MQSFDVYRKPLTKQRWFLISREIVVAERFSLLAIKEKEACDDAYESGTTVHAYCYFKAAKKFSKAKEEAKEEYERCIGK